VPLIAFPSFVKIVELQLSVRSVFGADRRPLLKTRGEGASLTEMWAGQVAFQTMTSADARAFAAWHETLDGRVNSFALPLAQGFATHVNSFAGVVASVVAGADVVRLNGSAVALRPGTLLAFGVPGDVNYQVCEVLEAASPYINTEVFVSPRPRTDIAPGTAVTGGTVTGAFALATDAPASSWGLQRGSATIDIVEAL
jgi:hypothetical protein